MPAKKGKEETMESGVACFRFEDGSLYNGCFTALDDNAISNKQSTLGLLANCHSANALNNSKRISTVTSVSNSAKGTYVIEEIEKGCNTSAVAEGAGYYLDSTGATYEGEWHEGNMSGKGVCEHPNGAIYNGYFNNNTYSQFGIYSWPDKSFYSGTWQNGKMHGLGVFVDSVGRHWTGEFVNGVCAELKEIIELEAIINAFQ